MNKPLWQPSQQRIHSAQITRFREDLQASGCAIGETYEALHRWSVENPAQFWEAVWRFGDVVGEGDHQPVLVDGDQFPGARWFPNTRLNFAENLLRHRDERPALVSLLENGDRRELSYSQLYLRVAQLASALRKLGVAPGDRVAGFLPNIEEAVVAMLAATSLGAVWSSCSPDFGINGVMDRFGQIQPKVLFLSLIHI